MDWQRIYDSVFPAPAHQPQTAGGIHAPEQEEHLRQRIRQLNHQIDDMSCSLRIPRGDLLVCVNRLLAAAQRKVV